VPTDIALVISFPHIVFALIVALVLFGGRKIPEIGKGLGEGIRNFKEGMKNGDNEAKKE